MLLSSLNLSLQSMESSQIFSSWRSCQSLEIATKEIIIFPTADHFIDCINKKSFRFPRRRKLRNKQLSLLIPSWHLMNWNLIFESETRKCKWLDQRIAPSPSTGKLVPMRITQLVHGIPSFTFRPLLCSVTWSFVPHSTALVWP